MTADLRRLAEQAIREGWEPFIVDPKDILALLDRLEWYDTVYPPIRDAAKHQLDRAEAAERRGASLYAETERYAEQIDALNAVKVAAERRVAALEKGLRRLLAYTDAAAECEPWKAECDHRPILREEGRKARALLDPAPSEPRCDRIVNNGMGEPTECGRTLPCEMHDPAALPAEVGEAAEGLRRARPQF